MTELISILEARVGRTVVEPKACQFIASKVAQNSGDARMVLETAINTVALRLEECKDTNATTEGPLVKIPNVMRAFKANSTDMKTRFDNLSSRCQTILCVLFTLAKCGHMRTKISTHRNFTNDCFRAANNTCDILDDDNFLVLLGTLVDTGLLRLHGRKNAVDLFNGVMSRVLDREIFLGHQLEEIEEHIQHSLKQTVFVRLREEAERKARDLRNM